jgi:hypothetical protein
VLLGRSSHSCEDSIHEWQWSESLYADLRHRAESLSWFSGAGAQSASQQSQGEAAAPSNLAEQQFKNIQALKGIPADQVIPSMQFIAASLGVECEYCHVHGANEKDDKKPKVTARKMIVMMMAINKDNFEGRREVTCFSCHHGAKDPVATPIISDEIAKPESGEGIKPAEAKPAERDGHCVWRRAISCRGLFERTGQAPFDHAPQKWRQHDGL